MEDKILNEFDVFSEEKDNIIYADKKRIYHRTKDEDAVHRIMYNKNFIPKIFDYNVFNCNTDNILQRLNSIKLEEIDHSIVTLDNVYCNPYAVRDFISELPHCLNNQYDKTFYPGYVAVSTMVRMFDLESIVTKLLWLKFRYLGFDIKNLDVDLVFSSALYTSKNITYENTPMFKHQDYETKFSISGIIYLNVEDEYDGGTSFFNKEGELLYINKMKFNSLILYPSKVFHAIHLDDIGNSFKDNYRITQRIIHPLPPP